MKKSICCILLFLMFLTGCANPTNKNGADNPTGTNQAGSTNQTVNATASPVVSPDPVIIAQGYVKTSGGKANVRKAPSTNADAITQLANGTKLDII